MSRRLLAAVFAMAAGWSLLGLGTKATSLERLTADEPQYVLSALSLAEDRDLDISDELADRRWRDFNEATLPRQTEPRADGSELSPHDPLLPVLLAPGVGLFGWVGARLTMAVVAGLLAVVLAWTATARLGVSKSVALAVVAAFCLSPPLTTYGSQIYPELPAALAVALAAAALFGPTSWRRTFVWTAAVVALPWLGVKYAGVAVALAVVGLWRDRNRAVPIVAGLAAAGVAYLVFHRMVYGGWTVYAAGDHFVDGELTVVGNDPNHLGRTIRLIGLLVDRHFGLVAWSPVYLLAVPALAAVARRGRRLRPLVLAPLAAGWATATWVALTMHGWWWPGRQTIVVLPLLVLATAWFVDRHRRLLPAVAVAGALGALTWVWLAVEATTGSITLISDFAATSNPWIRGWRWLLPDERSSGAGTVVRNLVWGGVLVASAAAGWRRGEGVAVGSETGAVGDDLGEDRSAGLTRELGEEVGERR